MAFFLEKPSITLQFLYARKPTALENYNTIISLIKGDERLRIFIARKPFA